MKNRFLVVLLAGTALAMGSCASRKVFSTNYYMENEKTLDSIQRLYRGMHENNRFSIAFNDRSFDYISLEILTDSIKYIDDFGIKEPRLNDTLVKYGLPVQGVNDLITQMRSIHCIWINNLDYYINNQKHSLVFMSIRHVAIHLPFTSEKYYILTFYAQPQFFDSEGRLLNSRRARKLRTINDDVFRRINDKVCYTISERFR